jgi:predicted transcriptional regulator
MGKEFLVENKNGDSKTYSLTQKGYDYLNKYNMIAEFTDSFGLERE